MTKDELLQELSQEIYAALRPSPIYGIGVFAVRTIPKGCRSIISSNKDNWVKLPITEVEKLPDYSRDLVETYCLYDEHHYFVPDYGFKLMDMVNYINHSITPNIKSVNEGEYFEALHEIPAGTELLIDYSLIVDHGEKYD